MHRRLGQHFLRSGKIVYRIATSLSSLEEKTVVEIGAGKGVLTALLLEQYEQVIAIEKDETLCALLRERFSSNIANKSLILVSSDVRDGTWRTFVQNTPYVVIANIPFYITGSLIRELLGNSHPPKALSLVVQKEVAKRITERDTRTSLLSLSVKLFSNPKYLFTIPRSAFFPSPQVDSALLGLFTVSSPPKELQETFFSIITTAFHEKRKVVLKKFTNQPTITNLLTKKGVTTSTRAEEIQFPVWLSVAKEKTKP